MIVHNASRRVPIPNTPIMSQNPSRRSKRQRSSSPLASSPVARPTVARRGSNSSLPPSSPPPPFSDGDDSLDDRDAIRDAEEEDEDDEEGEDLFAQNVEAYVFTWILPIGSTLIYLPQRLCSKRIARPLL